MYRLVTFLLLLSVCSFSMGQSETHVSKTVHTRKLIHEMPMNPETVEWQCDIYREILDDKDVNTPLFHPSPNKNLFYLIFKLFCKEKIKGYAFSLNDFDECSKEDQLDVKNVLDNYSIFYSRRNDSLIVEDINIPYDEVYSYYIKESVYYDLTNSCFRNKAVAICPVLQTEDDFGDFKGKEPVMWVLVDDICTQLREMSVVPNSYNRANLIQIADYFSRNLYSGDIYKVYNNRGLAFAEYCENDSLIKQERLATEKKLKDVRTKTYNTFYNDIKVNVQVKKLDADENKKRNKKRR